MPLSDPFRCVRPPISISVIFGCSKSANRDVPVIFFSKQYVTVSVPNGPVLTWPRLPVAALQYITEKHAWARTCTCSTLNRVALSPVHTGDYSPENGDIVIGIQQRQLPHCGCRGSNRYKTSPQLRQCSLFLLILSVVIRHHVHTYFINFRPIPLPQKQYVQFRQLLADVCVYQ